MPLDYAGSSNASGYTGDKSESEVTTFVLQDFAAKRNRRYNFDVQWEESAQLAWPEYGNTFQWRSGQSPGQKKAWRQVDSSVSIASHRFAALIVSLWTPSSSVWTRFYHPDDYVMKQRGAAEYYDVLTRTVHRERYRPIANFSGASLVNAQSLGVFGNFDLWTDAIDQKNAPGHKGLAYRAIPVGEIWYELDFQGRVCGFTRAFRWTAQQIYDRWPLTFPEVLRAALERHDTELYDIVQYVAPRTDWMPWRVDAKGKRWCSYYVSMTGPCLLEEGGYRTFPLATSRYMVAPNEEYGRGPMQMVLASAKTKNAQKSVFLEQGHLAGKPIYLTTDDATFELQRYPGAVNKGGLSAEGRKLVDVLETGNIQITKEMMDEEGRIIDDAFLVTLFQLALKFDEAPNLAARQVVEMIESRAMFLSPVTDGPHAEYFSGLIPRELDVLAYEGLLPPRPPVLVEAGDFEYEYEVTNPMTRMMMAGENASFMQMVEAMAEIARSTGDSSVWDHLNLAEAVPGMGRNRGVRPNWLATPQQLAQKQQQRAQQQAREQRAKEMPAQAAIIKANAISAKAQAGQNIGGTLSGVPSEQMPQVPGNPMGIPGVPGVFGHPGTSGIPAPQ